MGPFLPCGHIRTAWSNTSTDLCRTYVGLGLGRPTRWRHERCCCRQVVEPKVAFKRHAEVDTWHPGGMSKNKPLQPTQHNTPKEINLRTFASG